MASRFQRSLRAELPELVAAGVISDETARAIDRYFEAKRPPSRNLGFVLLATVGSALIAAGIILLVAHNWDELSRAARSVTAFLPLIAAQALCAFVLLRRDQSKPWRESAAIFNVAAVATAIALVSQTYQFHGSFADFLLTWLLLSLPLVYLMRTTLGAIAYVIGAAWWTWKVDLRWQYGGPLAFWLLFALVLPFVIGVYRRNRAARETSALWLACAIAICFGLGANAEFSRAHLTLLAFAGLFTATYICGMELFPRSEDERLHPLALLGALAIGVMAIVLTFEDPWRFSVSPNDSTNWARVLSAAIQLAFPVLAVGLVGWSLAKGRAHFSYAAAAFPVVVGIGSVLVRACTDTQAGAVTSYHCAVTSAILLNVYTLALGVELIARGIRAESTARTNFGLLVIAALAMARFFDSDLSFVVRAVGFIVIGVGFLVTNALLFRRRRRA